jgi:hypothetical protein
MIFAQAPEDLSNLKLLSAETWASSVGRFGLCLSSGKAQKSN